MSQWFAFVGDDANVEIGHQNDDSLVAMGPTHADVVEFAAVAQRDRSPVINVVATKPGPGQ
jgi:hypothetical protein